METRKGAASTSGPSNKPTTTSAIIACRWYSRGMQDERERVACALHEIELFWDRTPAQIHHDRKQAMLRQMEQAAQRFHVEQLGKPYVEYTGGAVQPW